jgi:hypothetical protein
MKTCIEGGDDCPYCRKNKRVEEMFRAFQVEKDVDKKAEILERMRVESMLDPVV